MRNIKVIFSQADKELAEKLCHRHEKLAERYLVLVNFAFTIIAGIILIASITLGVMLHFTTCATIKNSLYYIAVAALISLVSVIVLFLISVVFQAIYDDHSANALHYQFMSERMQEISEFENNLAFFVVSKVCPNAVTYNLPDGRCHHIKTVNDIPADSDVIITIKEDADAKGHISLNWYAKAV